MPSAHIIEVGWPFGGASFRDGLLLLNWSGTGVVRFPLGTLA